MRPLIKSSEFVFVKEIKDDKLIPGDMLLYEIDNKKYIHRILSINKIQDLTFQMIDDAGITDIHAISLKNVKGKVVSPFNGILGFVCHKIIINIFSLKRRLKSLI